MGPYRVHISDKAMEYLNDAFRFFPGTRLGGEVDLECEHGLMRREGMEDEGVKRNRAESKPSMPNAQGLRRHFQGHPYKGIYGYASI